MTDKQQTKEEIILAVKNAIYNNAEIDVECDCVQTDGNGVDHIADEVAEALYKANYRQVPPNAVVLTREEYNALMLEQKRLKEIVDRIPCGYELTDKTRKETAKEILQEVRKVCGDYQWFKNLCEKYGVEVQDNV